MRTSQTSVMAERIPPEVPVIRSARDPYSATYAEWIAVTAVPVAIGVVVALVARVRLGVALASAIAALTVIALIIQRRRQARLIAEIRRKLADRGQLEEFDAALNDAQARRRKKKRV